MIFWLCFYSYNPGGCSPSLLSGYNAGSCLASQGAKKELFSHCQDRKHSQLCHKPRIPRHALLLHAVVVLGQDLKILMSFSSSPAGAIFATMHPELPSTLCTTGVSATRADQLSSHVQWLESIRFGAVSVQLPCTPDTSEEPYMGRPSVHPMKVYLSTS